MGKVKRAGKTGPHLYRDNVVIEATLFPGQLGHGWHLTIKWDNGWALLPFYTRNQGIEWMRGRNWTPLHRDPSTRCIKYQAK